MSRLVPRILGGLLLVLAPAVSAQTLGAPTNLEFGEVVVDPSGGSLTLDPATGAVTSATGVYPTSALATASSAIVATDRAGRTANVYTTVSTFTLSGTGGSFSVSPGPFRTEYAGDAFTFPGTSGTTSQTFHVAGTLPIPAGQAPGDYDGFLPVFIQDNKGNNSGTANIPIHIRIIAPIALSNNQDLDMGTVIPGPTVGSVTLNPGTGAQGLAGGVVYASPTGQPAQFAVTGAPSHNFNISFGGTPITLTGPGGTMSLALLASPSGTSTFSAGGAATLNVGGTLSVGANQAEGDYTGTFTVTVAYP
ncbi:MAG TPA: DUF4402 domain-containing protein [Holophagaceae bacterium]|nr:DUF4402 domain-containing protein [Holophagaceae bacterium]